VALVLVDLQGRFIVVVAFEELLHAVSLQEFLVLLHLFCVGIFPFSVCIFSIEIIFYWRHKWSL